MHDIVFNSNDKYRSIKDRVGLWPEGDGKFTWNLFIYIDLSLVLELLIQLSVTEIIYRYYYPFYLGGVVELHWRARYWFLGNRIYSPELNIDSRRHCRNRIPQTEMIRNVLTDLWRFGTSTEGVRHSILRSRWKYKKSLLLFHFKSHPWLTHET